MCKLLKISRSSLYYYLTSLSTKKDTAQDRLTELVKDIFKKSRNNYGTRKIKVELYKMGYQVSRRKIG